MYSSILLEIDLDLFWNTIHVLFLYIQCESLTYNSVGFSMLLTEMFDTRVWYASDTNLFKGIVRV